MVIWKWFKKAFILIYLDSIWKEHPKINGATKGDISLKLTNNRNNILKIKGLTVGRNKNWNWCLKFKWKETNHTNLLAEKLKNNKQVEEGLNEQKNQNCQLWKRIVGQLTKRFTKQGNRKTLHNRMGDLGTIIILGTLRLLSYRRYIFNWNKRRTKEQADIYISFIGLLIRTDRDNRLASKRIRQNNKISWWKRHEAFFLGLMQMQPQSKKKRKTRTTNRQLKDWYKRRGFVFDEYSHHGYRKTTIYQRTQNKENKKMRNRERDYKGESPGSWFTAATGDDRSRERVKKR